MHVNDKGWPQHVDTKSKMQNIILPSSVLSRDIIWFILQFPEFDKNLEVLEYGREYIVFYIDFLAQPLKRDKFLNTNEKPNESDFDVFDFKGLLNFIFVPTTFLLDSLMEVIISVGCYIKGDMA